MGATEEPPQKHRRIAVIGIHGVGEHLPGATARGIARQLQHTQHGAYGGFQDIEHSIPVDAGAVHSGVDLPSTSTRWLSRLTHGFGSNFKKAVEGGTAKPIDIEFSRSLLASCDGDTYHAVYDTVALVGADVDIHELYWSDLSHFSSGAFATFDQIIQLMIHVASFGRTVAATILGKLDGVSARETWWWGLFYGLNATSYWLLSVPILVGNLILGLLAVLLIPAMLPQGDSVAVPVAITVLAATTPAVSVGYFLFARTGHRPRDPSAPWTIVFGSLLAGAAAAGLAEWWLSSSPGTTRSLRAMAGLELPLVFAIGEAMMRSYDKSRPGALTAWHAMAGLLGLWMVALLAKLVWWPDAADKPLTLSVWLGHTVEGAFGFLVLLWGALYVTNLALWVVGTTLKFTGSTRASADITRSVNTCFIAASLPAPLFLAMVLSLWAVAYRLFKTSIESVPTFTPWCRFLFGRPDTAPDKHSDASAFIGGLIDKSANPLFLIYVVLMLVAALLLVWGVLPSILAELFPPDGHKKPVPHSTRSLGNWLDGGFGAFGCAAVLAAFGFFAVLPAGSVLAYWPRPWGFLANNQFLNGNRSFIAYSGAIFGATSLSFLAATKLLASSLSTFFGRLRVPIDTALDVDNWLRERPVGATVRLKIFARFAALLKSLESRGYTAIVIVAHSQGTVIVSDFFRYMHSEKPEVLTRLPPCHLLTMGSPLRQLYALRFPTLYRWVDRPAKSDAEGGPSPAACGFDSWTNAYGSGDYVGRYLWRADNEIARWSPEPYSPNPESTELCVGPSAHTHYFDEDNFTIGNRVDALIRRGKSGGDDIAARSEEI